MTESKTTLAKMLLDMNDDQESMAQTLEQMKAALAAGADPNAPDRLGYTPLMRCATFWADTTSLIDTLVAAGARVDETYRGENVTSHGRTALMLACTESSAPENLVALLKHRARTDLKAWGESTALHLAAVEGKTKHVQLLVAAGAKLEVEDKYESTPLALAANFAHLPAIVVLLKAGAKVTDKVKEAAEGCDFVNDDVIELLEQPERAMTMEIPEPIEREWR